MPPSPHRSTTPRPATRAPNHPNPWEPPPDANPRHTPAAPKVGAAVWSSLSVILGTKVMIILSSDTAIKDLLDKRSVGYSDRHEHYIGQTILSGDNHMLMMRYGSTWRMMRKMIHNLLGVQKADAYVPYQDLESKQMLHGILVQPEQFLDSCRRYTSSLTTSMTYGFRTVSFEDPRMLRLFGETQITTEILQSIAAATVDV